MKLAALKAMAEDRAAEWITEKVAETLFEPCWQNTSPSQDQGNHAEAHLSLKSAEDRFGKNGNN